MDDINEHIPGLIIKHLKNELSEEEQSVLEEWLNQSERNEHLFNELINEEQLNKKLQQFNRVEKDSLWNKTLEKINSENNPDVFKPINDSISWRKITIAASILVVLSIAVYFLLPDKTQNLAVEKPAYGEIVPGRNTATLTLSDGSLVLLDGTSNENISDGGNIRISKVADEQIVYKLQSANSNSNNTKIKYNQISTPRGGQYQIVLPDRTKVWLNAASSLRFSLEPINGVRHVELTGEAYFDVSSQRSESGERIPFRVSTPSQTVEVLGTQFNINSYEDEGVVKTTLVEGSVRVFINDAIKSGKHDGVFLKPDQQSVLKSNQIQVIPADVESAIAWKEGYNIFRSESLESIMRKISRWYDVEIIFQGNTASHQFGGKISRKENISKVLEIIGATGNVSFRIENSDGKNKRIIVLPSNDPKI